MSAGGAVATPRIKPSDLSEADGRAKEILEELSRGGREPGLMVRTMAQAPALLRGYVDLSRAMKRSHLDRRVAERIAIAAQSWIGCDLCLAAHTAAARELGVSEVEIALARQGTASDRRTAAIVAFGQQLVAAPAEIDDDQVAELRSFGYTDEQLAEVVGLAALQLLTGSFNLLAGLHPEEEARV
jgi:AhpD family alkylhydroperoxidase